MFSSSDSTWLVNILFLCFNVAFLIVNYNVWHALRDLEEITYPAKGVAVNDWTRLEGAYFDQRKIVEHIVYFMAEHVRLHHEDIPTTLSALSKHSRWYRVVLNTMTSPLHYLSKYYYVVYDAASDSGVLMCSRFEKDFSVIMEFYEPIDPNDVSNEAVLYRLAKKEIAAAEAT